MREPKKKLKKSQTQVRKTQPLSGRVYQTVRERETERERSLLGLVAL